MYFLDIILDETNGTCLQRLITLVFFFFGSSTLMFSFHITSRFALPPPIIHYVQWSFLSLSPALPCDEM